MYYSCNSYFFVFLPQLEVASKRRIHTLSVFVMSCNHVWLIATGGIIDDHFVQFPENVTLTELG